MTEPARGPVLYLIVCGAGPAADAGRLVEAAQRQGWIVQVIATPSALEFIDTPALEGQTGSPVRSRYRSPGQPRSPRADAIIVAPASYNTINKWAVGISDTYALGVLAEAPGLGIPVVVLPFVNTALAARRPFRDSIGQLQTEGVCVLFGPGVVEPHPAGTGDEHATTFPWQLALKTVEDMRAVRTCAAVGGTRGIHSR